MDGLAAAAPALIAVVGPTAAGKSALSLRLAREHAGEIVSCDSLQVYRGLDIGSAKPTLEERVQVPHHLLDVVEPDAVFSAADYSRLARRALAGIAARGRLPLVVGGTGLYFRALFRGLFSGPSRDEVLRERIEGVARRLGDAGLHRLLARVDPEAAARIAPADRVRIVRALEVWKLTSRPLSAHLRENAGEPLRGYRSFVVGLDPGRDKLREAVAARARAMLAAGLVDEVRGLLSRGVPAAARPLGAIGYREAMGVVRGEATADEALRDIVAATMRLAKRQLTWFRKEPSVTWFASGEQAAVAVAGFLAAGPERAS